MADLSANAGWPGVPQLETNTVALGGPAGPMNSQAMSLLARTELLRSLIGSYDDFITHNANATLTAADVGKTHTSGNSGASITLTLPAANLIRKGSVITFIAGNKPIVVQAAAGNFVSHPLMTNISSFTIAVTALNGALNGGGLEQTFICDGVSRWIPMGGVHAINAMFTSGNNNVIRLPDGKIIQYGAGTSTQDPIETFNFHVAFPTECQGVFISRLGTASPGSPIEPFSYTASQFTINRANSIDGNNLFNWIAVGR